MVSTLCVSGTHGHTLIRLITVTHCHVHMALLTFSRSFGSKVKVTDIHISSQLTVSIELKMISSCASLLCVCICKEYFCSRSEIRDG